MAMKLTHYIRPDCFLPALLDRTREDALRTLVHAVAAHGDNPVFFISSVLS